jgi:hypothetical protein
MKYKRTMQEAFGPYTDDRIYTEPDYPHAGAILVICIVAVGIAIWLAV